MKGQQPDANPEYDSVERAIDNHVWDLFVSINLHHDSPGRIESGGFARLQLARSDITQTSSWLVKKIVLKVLSRGKRLTLELNGAQAG